MDSCNFGVEIEVIVEPHRVRDPLQPAVYYELLAAALRERGLNALADNLTERYRKHPEHYNKWWITKDGSLGNPSHPGIAMEAVSPTLCSRRREQERRDWETEIDTFWRAMSAVFHMPRRSRNCGSHVHVSSLRGFTLSDAKRIACGVVRYEKQVQQILPASRRDNVYCQRNSKNSNTLSEIPLLYDRAIAIGNCTSLDDLKSVMQDDRRVLWNFANITATPGRIEFRGGRGLRGPVRTKRWIAFAIGFIESSLKKSKRDFFDGMEYLRYYEDEDDYDPVTVEEFYEDLRGAAGQHSMLRYLPAEYEVMNETLSEYNLGAEADSTVYSDSDSDSDTISIISKGASIDSDDSSDTTSTHSKEAPSTSSDGQYSSDSEPYLSPSRRHSSECIVM